MPDEQEEIPKYQFLRSVMYFDLLALVLLMLRSVAGFVSQVNHSQSVFLVRYAVKIGKSIQICYRST